MVDDLLGRLSGADDPYAVNTYTPVAGKKSTLTITDYFKLLVAQLANQNMTNPMGNSEMMTQMTQVVMIRVVSAMTEFVQTSTSVNTQVCVAGLVGQEITVAVIEEWEYEQDIAIGVQYGKVESVNFTGSTPVLKLMGDDNGYPLSYVLEIGKVDDPYKKDGADGKQTKGKDVEGEKTDFPACGCAAEEGNPLANKGVLV